MKKLLMSLLIILSIVKVSLASDLQQQVQQVIKEGAPKTVKIVEPGGTGSGFIISANGYIATAAHVVAGRSEVEVTLNNKRWYKARVVSTSLVKDLAIIKIYETGLPYFKLADSSKNYVGQFVVTIGYPKGKYAATFGIISNLLEVGEDGLSYTKSDAALNPGSSGGPMIDLNGEVIAVNDAIETEANTISYSIPSNTLSDILIELLKEEK